MKFKTVRSGQQAVIYNLYGEGRLIEGPQRVFLYRERLEFLKERVATAYSYLVITENDGTVKHIRGPCQLFENPLLYQSVEVKTSTVIDANHLIVVYKRLKDSDVQRRLVQGPTIFMPEPDEWIHQFKWHGSDQNNKARMVPGLRVFDQLAIIPDQFYYDVREVRTSDDTMITVKLMIFYELKDVSTMLDKTNDPIADMINAVCSDVISFAGKLTFEGFLQKTGQLSSLSTFPQLVQRAEGIGHTIQKVVYRGYHASEKLQAMQNSAIESRTQLRLNAEIEEQKQKLADFQLTREHERSKLVQEMEKAKQEHKQKLADLKQQHLLEMSEVEHQQDQKVQTMRTQAKLDTTTAENEERIKFLEELQKLSVNLTDYLALEQGPQVTEEFRVSTRRPQETVF